MASIGGNERSREGRAATLLAMAAREGRACAEAANLVRDAGAFNQCDELVESYERRFRDAIARGESIYQPMPPFMQAAHERRMELLDRLPIGDLSDKVCVDYGVGSWGFACIYPRLQRCGYAIGIDVSYEAIRESARISATGEYPYGKHYSYITSRGDDLKLKDGSVDLFFAGECVEHVENTDAFLDEVHRVLKPGGLLILTTPNADAYLYRMNGERYCVGAEHVALMSYTELRRYLDPRFEILVAQGFNGSLYHTLDERIQDPAFARAWAALFLDQPELAASLVIMARRRDDYRSSRHVHVGFHHQSPSIMYEGRWQTVPLHEALTGRLTEGGDRAALTIDFDGSDLLVFFWTHPWSGRAFVEVDGVARDVELYAAQGGFRRVHVADLSAGRHRLRICGREDRDPRSLGNQLIFHRAIGYQRSEPAQALAAAPRGTAMEARPGRFGIVYHTPARMTSAERVLLYGLVFALRPKRCLEIGTYNGGSSLIIGAALDDVGAGHLVCVDPKPLVASEHWQQLRHHATLVTGPSPEVLPEAVAAAGGAFDFVLIDGDHGRAGVAKDIEGVLPVLTDGAYVIFHDAHYFEVAEAIDEMVHKHAERLMDCGMLSTEQTPEGRSIEGKPVIWGGLRLLRHRAAA